MSGEGENRGKRRTREVAKVSVGSGMHLWEGGAEGDQVFLSHTACHSLFLCIFSRLLPLCLVPPPSEPSLASRLDRAPAHGFAPLPPLVWNFSCLLCKQPVESPWPSPSPCLSNQSSQFAGAQFLIVFSSATGQAALAWLSGFGFFSGPSQHSTWGVFSGSMGDLLISVTLLRK